MKIAKKYLHERFWVDVLATIPFDIIAQVTHYSSRLNLVASRQWAKRLNPAPTVRPFETH